MKLKLLRHCDVLVQYSFSYLLFLLGQYSTPVPANYWSHALHPQDYKRSIIFFHSDSSNDEAPPTRELGDSMHSPHHGTRCVVPFVYRNNTYWHCTTAGGSGDPWCAVKVDAQRNVLERARCNPGWCEWSLTYWTAYMTKFWMHFLPTGN